jgi:putative ABC transport system substrate-binding protein
MPVIAVLKSRNSPLYDAALVGFHRALRDKRIQASVLEFDMCGDTGSLVKKIRGDRPALIVSAGTLATELAKNEFKELPVLFCMVLNPVSSGLVKSMEHPGENITGASLDISSRQQFEVVKTVLPQAKRIGVLYSPRTTTPLIKEATATAAAAGFKLIAIPVPSESDLPQALQSLEKTKIDCLWAVSDGMVFSSLKSIQHIILYTLHNDIPFMGLSSSFVKSGALFAITSDPQDNGYQAGEAAARILAGQSASAIPVSVPRKTFVSINLKIAHQIKMTVPADVLAHAQEVMQ